MAIRIVDQFQDVSALSLAAGDTVIITRNGTLTGDAGPVTLTTTLQVLVEGLVVGRSGAMALTSDSTVRIRETGTVAGEIYAIQMIGTDVLLDNAGLISNRTVVAGTDARINNTGTISAAGNAVTIGGNLSYLQNSGTITGNVQPSDNIGEAIFAGGADQTNWVVNWGTISAYWNAIRGGLGVNYIVNHGRIDGNILFGGGTVAGERLINTGTIFGSVSNFGTAGGRVDNSGHIGVALTMTTGNDQVTNSGYVNSINFGSGAAADVLLNSGKIGGPVTGFGLASYVRNSGDMDGPVSLSSGSDFVVNTGTIWSLNMGGGTGTDRLWNGGLIEGSVTFVVTADVVNAGQILGALTTAGGNDVVVNRGELRSVSLGGGNDIYRAGPTGSVEQSVTGGTGNDLLRGGDLDDWLQGDAGNDTLRGRDGDDTLTGLADNDLISGGDGDDIVQGGSGIDTVTGGAGADRFVFAAAADLAVAGLLDTITDFQRGVDVIDLRSIHPGVLVFAGAGALPGGGTAAVNYGVGATSVTLQVDLDGNGTVDGRIVLQGLSGLAAGDLLL